MEEVHVSLYRYLLRTFACVDGSGVFQMTSIVASCMDWAQSVGVSVARKSRGYRNWFTTVQVKSRSFLGSFADRAKSGEQKRDLSRRKDRRICISGEQILLN